MSLMSQTPKPLMTLLDRGKLGLKMLPFVPALAKWGLVSAQEFAGRCKDPFLRRAGPHIFTWPEIPTMAGLSLLAYLHMGNAGFLRPRSGQALRLRSADPSTQFHCAQEMRCSAQDTFMASHIENSWWLCDLVGLVVVFRLGPASVPGTTD